tara:strand:- start:759 stop:899 length:141 start_codon:yes stop_codon:yes gene_type:complete
MPIVQLAGRVPWGQLLHDDLTKKEDAEKRHILKEGRDAEEDFKRKH